MLETNADCRCSCCVRAIVTFNTFILSIVAMVMSVITSVEYGNSYSFLAKYITACASEASMQPTSASINSLAYLGVKFYGDQTYYSAAAICEFENYADTRGLNCYCNYGEPQRVYSDDASNSPPSQSANCTRLSILNAVGTGSDCSQVFDALPSNTHVAFGLSLTVACLLLLYSVITTLSVIFTAWCGMDQLDREGDGPRINEGIEFGLPEGKNVDVPHSTVMSVPIAVSKADFYPPSASYVTVVSDTRDDPKHGDYYRGP
jgi:hypothetical protein